MPKSKPALSRDFLQSQEFALRALIARKLGDANAHAIDDIWQELLIAAQSESSSIENPSAWAKKVISHKVADYFRSRQRNQRLEEQISEKAIHPSSPTPFDWVLELEDRQQVNDALALLSEENRQILRMKYYQGDSVAKIATRIGITTKAAEYRLHRARVQLREIITTNQKT